MNRSAPRVASATRHRPNGVSLRSDLAKLSEKLAKKPALLVVLTSAVSSGNLDAARRAVLRLRACLINTSAKPMPI